MRHLNVFLFFYEGEGNFIGELINFDKDNISDRTLKKITGYVSDPQFTPDTIGRVSFAAKSLCMWVQAMEVYGRIYRVVEPKKKVDLACQHMYVLQQADKINSYQSYLDSHQDCPIVVQASTPHVAQGAIEHPCMFVLWCSQLLERQCSEMHGVKLPSDVSC